MFHYLQLKTLFWLSFLYPSPLEYPTHAVGTLCGWTESSTSSAPAGALAMALAQRLQMPRGLRLLSGPEPISWHSTALVHAEVPCETPPICSVSLSDGVSFCFCLISVSLICLIPTLNPRVEFDHNEAFTCYTKTENSIYSNTFYALRSSVCNLSSPIPRIQWIFNLLHWTP